MSRTRKDTILSYTVVFQKEPEGGYTVYTPVLPGCISYGKDLEEAKTRIQEAIELYVESLKEHKEEVPTENNIFYTKITIDSSKLSYPYA